MSAIGFFFFFFYGKSPIDGGEIGDGRQRQSESRTLFSVALFSLSPFSNIVAMHFLISGHNAVDSKGKGVAKFVHVRAVKRRARWTPISRTGRLWRAGGGQEKATKKTKRARFS